MALLFTEIVNQLNALSCLHGDDDDDEGDGGFLKRARKAATKPAASSQGLCSPFFHLAPRLPDSLVMLSPLNFHSFPQLFGFPSSIYFPGFLLISPILYFVMVSKFISGPCGNVLYIMLWTCQLVFIFPSFCFFCVFFKIVDFPFLHCNW